jgi:hypothetical protein
MSPTGTHPTNVLPCASNDDTNLKFPQDYAINVATSLNNVEKTPSKQTRYQETDTPSDSLRQQEAAFSTKP